MEVVESGDKVGLGMWQQLGLVGVGLRRAG